ncbi:MAG: hypothetical protein ACK4IX_02985 [Candidatus Sericytochromatia bacterium]
MKTEENIIKTTLSKSIIKVNQDTEKSTIFLCGHVSRIINELKIKDSNLKISGFIHIPQYPSEESFYEVLGLGIMGILEKLKNKNNITIMITGFTKFKKVTDNYTSKYLFGDGVSENIESFGIKIPNKDIINKINHLISKISKEKLIVSIESNYLKISIKEYYLNLFFVRLPVDENMDKDTTGTILKESYKIINPNAILSFGVGIYPDINPEQNTYHIETISYGMKNAFYNTSDKFIKNEDLIEIYKMNINEILNF